MAAAKKSQPLTLEELLDAQLKMLKDPALSEGQREQAKKQIEILEGIRTGVNIGNVERIKEDGDIRRMTRPKGDASNVTLGDVRTELRGMREDLKTLNVDGKSPAVDRAPLPMPAASEPITIDVPARDITGQVEDAERVERLQKIGGLLGQKTALARGGSRNEGLTARNSQAFERFVLESKDRQALLADADQRQLEIFEKLEDTLIQLKEADSEQSKALIQEMAKLKGALKETGDTQTRGKLDKMLTGTMRSAQIGSEQQHGTLGDAFAALRGKREVLKEGYRRDERTGRVHEVDAETGQIGKMVKAKDASMGRLGGAAKILGSFAMNKFEENLESKRDPAWQNFFDNFRQTENARGAGATRLPEVQGQLDELMNKRPAEAQAKPQKVRPDLKVIPGGLDRAAAKTAGRMQAQVISITGNVVNIKGGEIRGLEALAAPADNRFKGAGSRAGIKPKTEEEKKAQEQEGGGGGLLETALDLGGSLLGGGKGMLSKAGGMLKGAGGKLLGGGKMLGAGLKGALSTAGGATLATGAAMVAAPFVTDYVAGKFGVGKDEKGNDLVVNEKQDDANWERASLWEKIQSAPARGIEKVGSLFGGNMARQARADRIKSETEYLNKKYGEPQPAQTTVTPASAVAGTGVLATKGKAAPIPGGGQITNPDAPDYNADYAELVRDKQEMPFDHERAQPKTPMGESNTRTRVTEASISGLSTGDMEKDPKFQEILKKEMGSGPASPRQENMARRVAQMKYKAGLARGEIEPPAGVTVSGRKTSETLGRDEKVGQLSSENQLQRDSGQSKPVVINNSTPAPAAPAQTQTFAPRGGVRGDESALDNFHKSRTQYFW